MKSPKTKKIVYYESSDNIFRDLNVKNPELKHIKAEISIFLMKYKKEKKIGDKTLAKRIGISEKKLLKIYDNPINFKLSKLFKYLFILGYDSKIDIKPLHKLGMTKRIETIVKH